MIIALKRTRNLPSGDGSILGNKTFIVSEDGLLEESESNLQQWKGIKFAETNDKP
ncbi:MAG: hypothetical protein KAS71_04490 [Bacteroidales bacterium]|nr:hypothetical protein [Bacteroidales bacterium]